MPTKIDMFVNLEIISLTNIFTGTYICILCHKIILIWRLKLNLRAGQNINSVTG